MLDKTTKDKVKDPPCGEPTQRSEVGSPQGAADRSIVSRSRKKTVTELDRWQLDGSSPNSRLNLNTHNTQSSNLRERVSTLAVNFNNHVGIDVSKYKLDVVILPSKNSLSVTNDSMGYDQLLPLLPTPGSCLIVVESTGKYQCDLVDFLQLHHYHVAVVNPKSVRHFAKGLGFLAKNDKLDAFVLAQFAQLAKPDVHKKYSVIQQDINELISRRRQLVELAKLEKQHLEAARKQSLKDAAQKNVKLFQQQIKQLDKELLKLLEQDDEWKDKAEILKSVPGIGDTTALTLIAELPELGDVNRAEVAALVGVAPYDHDSGKLKGVRSIQGGRANLRRCLFMATTTAMRCNPLIKAFKLRLKDAKKPYKVIVIACMRKLLSIVNTMIRNNTKWKLENV